MLHTKMARPGGIPGTGRSDAEHSAFVASIALVPRAQALEPRDLAAERKWPWQPMLGRATLYDARQITLALRGRWDGRNGLARCPAHDDARPSLSLSDREGGGLLLHCFAGCSYPAIRDALIARRLWPDARAHPAHPALRLPPPPRAPLIRWSAKADAIWRRTIPLAGTPAETYLRSRRCWVPDACDLGFRPSWRDRAPALVARITDIVTAEPLNLLFVLLQPDGCGKANTQPNKVVLKGHQKRGGVIRLTGDADVTIGLNLAEGLENALSILADDWAPVWATVDCGNLHNFPVLPGIESLTVFPDCKRRDDPGLRAAEACGRRWGAAGREVQIVPPDSPGDWNDTVRRTA